MTKLPDPIITSESPNMRWTVDRYHRAIENGVLTEEDNIELIDGKLSEKMPIGDPHVLCVQIINNFFIRRYMDQYKLGKEDPIVLGNLSEPEPDYYISKLLPLTLANAKPRSPDIYLVIEVADSSLDKDRKEKLPIYAHASLPEYWIINLPERHIEVYTQPQPDNNTYSQIGIHPEGESFTSPFCGPVTVADLLPPPYPTESGTENS